MERLGTAPFTDIDDAFEAVFAGAGMFSHGDTLAGKVLLLAVCGMGHSTGTLT
jgi:hypothetical protein